MFDLNVTQFMQVRLPLDVLGQIVRYAAGKEDMPGVGAIHYPLRQVNAGSGYVLPLVHVEGVIDRAAIDSHPQRKLGMLAEPATNLSCAMHRRIHAGEKNQRHTVACRYPHEFTCGIRGTKLLGVTNNVVEQGEDLALLAAKQLGTTDNVYARFRGEKRCIFRRTCAIAN